MTDATYAVARTACMEAASDGTDGIHAVINVIYNRAKTPGWWGDTPVDIATKASAKGVHQFSCWNAGSPTLEWGDKLAIGGNTADDKLFGNAVIMSNLSERKALTDITNGADSYYREGTPVPVWALGREPVAKIGHHLFFVLGLTGTLGLEAHAENTRMEVAKTGESPLADATAMQAEVKANANAPGKVLASVRNAVLYAAKNPGQWVAESTTLIGFALIGVAFWEYIACALTVAQAEGLMAAGAALLYPQSSGKASAVVTSMTTVMDAIESGRDAHGTEHKS